MKRWQRRQSVVLRGHSTHAGYTCVKAKRRAFTEERSECRGSSPTRARASSWQLLAERGNRSDNDGLLWQGPEVATDLQFDCAVEKSLRVLAELEGVGYGTGRRGESVGQGNALAKLHQRTE